nr:toll/interleukin-1 receptor domain-containing protein [Candidatus Sigynarchaeota archaeon]
MVDLPFQSDPTDKPFAFVSYSHADSTRVFPIIKKFHDAGIHLWYDEGIEPSAHWRNAIAENIINCTVFISFISPNIISTEKDKPTFPEKEINLAIDKGKKIISIFLERTNLSPGLELEVPNWQAIMLYQASEDMMYSKLVPQLRDIVKSDQASLETTWSATMSIVQECEWKLQLLVEKVLSEEYGPKWFEKCFDPENLTELVDAWERYRLYKPDTPFRRTITWSHLVSIVKQKHFHGAFQEQLGLELQSKIQAEISMVRNIRNVASHAGEISRSDAMVVTEFNKNLTEALVCSGIREPAEIRNKKDHALNGEHL